LRNPCSFGEAQPYAKDAVANATKIMGQIVQGFKDNPWVRMKGFKVMLGVSPRVDIDLEVPPFRQ
jgi:predicted RNA-binding protein associated with RNAse of E/G family